MKYLLRMVLMWSDRIEFLIPWGEFTPGASIFIPSMNPRMTLARFRQEAEQHGAMFTFRFVVENGVQGLRVWRS